MSLTSNWRLRLAHQHMTFSHLATSKVLRLLGRCMLRLFNMIQGGEDFNYPAS